MFYIYNILHLKLFHIIHLTCFICIHIFVCCLAGDNLTSLILITVFYFDVDLQANLLCKSMGWFLYCRDHRHERVNSKKKSYSPPILQRLLFI